MLRRATVRSKLRGKLSKKCASNERDSAIHIRDKRRSMFPECLMLRCSIWYFIERIKQVQVISLQRDIKVSCKIVDDHAELEFNQKSKGSAILLAKSTKIDFGAARIKHFLSYVVGSGICESYMHGGM